MSLNAENYFSYEMNKKYMSVSQYKSFKKCEYAALSELEGLSVKPKSTALLVGSYVDAYYEGTLEKFKEENPEIFNSRNGQLKADYKAADRIIFRTRLDEMFQKYMSGDKQMIMTGEIEGVPVKVKIDSYHPHKAIVDLKVMRDFKPIYVEGEGKLNFIEAWGYDLQGAVYQEIVRQNTGETLPFYICAVTKEEAPDIAIIQIEQPYLDVKLEEFKQNIEQYQAIKDGLIAPSRCEHCEECKNSKSITRIMTMEDLNNYA